MLLKPSPKMKTLYVVYALLFLVIGVFSWCIPLTLLFLGDRLTLLMLLVTVYAPISVALAFFIYWLPRYYDSVTYLVEEDRLVARRGVWWVRESSIPLSRVNNVIYMQGPLQRALGLASLGFHTAAKGVPVPEVSFAHMEAEEAENVRETVLRRLKLVPRETYEEKTLRELSRIRELLEKLTGQ